MLGNERECERAIGEAETHLGGVRTDDPAAALFCPSARDRMVGSVYLYLGKPAKAEPILNATHKLLKQRKKSTAIVLGNLSLACIRQQRIDDAVGHLHQAIEVLEQTRGGGGLNVVFTAARELRPWREAAAVAEVNDGLLSLMSTA